MLDLRRWTGCARTNLIRVSLRDSDQKLPKELLPAGLLPRDPRFGSGPSKIRPESLASMLSTGSAVIGTSHRQPPVRQLVARLRAALGELYQLPDGYEVMLGNGGTTAFWDAAVFCLIDQVSAHATYGEFSAKFASAATRAPHLQPPLITSSAPGTAVLPDAAERADTYAWAHHETSTGVIAPVRRVSDQGLMLIDATSAAGGVEVDVAAGDVYYFAPQKCFGSDGGLWLALCSPAAVERIERIAASGRWIPDSLSLDLALRNSRLDQTLNTPAVITLWLMLDQCEWLLSQGGLSFAAARSRRSSGALYDWAEASPVAQPFVASDYRSPLVVTIDFDESIDAAGLSARLRGNGILDTEAYRKLGRNQLRIGTYPNVDADDAVALTRCLDWLIERLAG